MYLNNCIRYLQFCRKSSKREDRGYTRTRPISGDPGGCVLSGVRTRGATERPVVKRDEETRGHQSWCPVSPSVRPSPFTRREGSPASRRDEMR